MEVSYRRLPVTIGAFVILTASSFTLPIPLAAAGPICDNQNPQSLDEHQLKEIEARVLPYKLNTNWLPAASTFYEITGETNGRPIQIKATKFHATIIPSKGTVVYLCGGPIACMKERPGIVPPDFDVVESDYIGLGQNTLGPAPPEMMSIEGQAQAIKTVVQGLKLNNYLIYGQSYGTVVATAAASKIGNDLSMPQPKSLILEGVGGSWQTQTAAGYLRAADRAFEMLSIEEKEQFKVKYKQAMELATPEMRDRIDNALIHSLLPGPKAAANYLRNFSKRNLMAQKEQAPRVLRLLNPVGAPNADLKPPKPIRPEEDPVSYARMFRAGGCQIMNHRKDPPDRLFGDLVVNYNQTMSLCDCRTVKRNFDSKYFQVKTPIIYINGDQDPATPIEGAKYHYENQKSTNKKIFITIKDGGHFSTSNEMASCQSLLFNSAISGDLTPFAARKDFSTGCLGPVNAPGPTSSSTTR